MVRPLARVTPLKPYPRAEARSQGNLSEMGNAESPQFLVRLFPDEEISA
jgi:hypothetical protein